MSRLLAPVLAAALLLAIGAPASAAPVVFTEHVSFAGWKNCVKLTNGRVELIMTTDVGPRVIRFGFVGGQNMFHNYPDQVGKTGGDAWRNYGGHRLWHAPEVEPRTYWGDNAPVAYQWDGQALTLSQPLEATTGIAKQITIGLDADTDHVTLVHKLTNRGSWGIELAPWALTVMAPGGRAIFPQEPYIPHPQKLTPARPFVMWHYTDLKDPRWSYGTKYIQLTQDPRAKTKQKAGLANSLGWAAYQLKGDLFIKRYPFIAGATYPDFGANTEAYTDADMLEIETLGPLTRIEPGGAAVHTEHWFLVKEQVGTSESDLDRMLLPRVQSTARYKL